MRQAFPKLQTSQKVSSQQQLNIKLCFILPLATLFVFHGHFSCILLLYIGTLLCIYFYSTSNASAIGLNINILLFIMFKAYHTSGINLFIYDHERTNLKHENSFFQIITSQMIKVQTAVECLRKKTFVSF